MKGIDKLVLYYDRDKNIITIQEKDYIDNGCIIKIRGASIELFELSMHGNMDFIGEYKTLIDALNKMYSLT